MGVTTYLMTTFRLCLFANNFATFTYNTTTLTVLISADSGLALCQMYYPWEVRLDSGYSLNIKKKDKKLCKISKFMLSSEKGFTIINPYILAYLKMSLEKGKKWLKG